MLQLLQDCNLSQRCCGDALVLVISLLHWFQTCYNRLAKHTTVQERKKYIHASGQSSRCIILLLRARQMIRYLHFFQGHNVPAGRVYGLVDFPVSPVPELRFLTRMHFELPVPRLYTAHFQPPHAQAILSLSLDRWLWPNSPVSALRPGKKNRQNDF